MEFDFNTLPYTKDGEGVETSDIYLEFEGKLNLCIALLVAELPRKKVLTYHYAVSSPEFGDYNIIQFDIRELLSVDDINLPVKGDKKLAKAAKEIGAKFDTDEEILAAIIELAHKKL